MELTLLHFDKQWVLQELLQNYQQMFDMLLRGFREDQNVTDVYEYKTIDHVSQHIVD